MDLVSTAARLIANCRAAGLTLGCAESCTGGFVLATLTAVPGCSDVVEGGVVTYSNALKTRLLGVSPAILAVHGAVSEAVAGAMVAGVLDQLGVDLAVAVTGIAGPGGGSVEKPVGLVWIGSGRADQAAMCRRFVFQGDRQSVREQSVRAALAALAGLLDNSATGSASAR